nr:hypothetical protein [uncultured Undibacterium sp.]
MAWYGIRNIYHFGVKSDGVNIFEERIVCFEANSEEEAHIKGLKEANEYALSNDFEVGLEQYAYMQDGDALIDGYEVYSQLFESTQSLEEFYANRYERYQHYPECKLP